MLLQSCGNNPVGTVQASASAQVKRVASPRSQGQAPQNKYSGTLVTIGMLPRKTFSTDFWDSGWTHAEGTWTLEEGKLGMPVQTSKITCIRDIDRCFHATAEVFGSMLIADSDILEIERWDAQEIVTKHVDSECVRSTIRISREQHSVSEIQTTFKTTGPCANLGLKLGDQHLHLIDGFEAAIKIRTEQK